MSFYFRYKKLNILSIGTFIIEYDYFKNISILSLNFSNNIKNQITGKNCREFLALCCNPHTAVALQCISSQHANVVSTKLRIRICSLEVAPSLIV